MENSPKLRQRYPPYFVYWPQYGIPWEDSLGGANVWKGSMWQELSGRLGLEAGGIIAWVWSLTVWKRWTEPSVGSHISILSSCGWHSFLQDPATGDLPDRINCNLGFEVTFSPLSCSVWVFCHSYKKEDQDTAIYKEKSQTGKVAPENVNTALLLCLEKDLCSLLRLLVFASS